jgi:hypothetical protein
VVVEADMTVETYPQLETRVVNFEVDATNQLIRLLKRRLLNM